jgi:hypothetical protein
VPSPSESYRVLRSVLLFSSCALLRLGMDESYGFLMRPIYRLMPPRVRGSGFTPVASAWANFSSWILLRLAMSLGAS